MPWVVKKLLNLREECIRYIGYKPGFNSSFLLWHDPWALRTLLISHMDPMVISIVESHSLAKINSIVFQDQCRLPPSTHRLAIEFRTIISSINLNQHDHITWDGYYLLKVNLSSIYKSIRSQGTSLFWLKAVSHILAIPKCSFVLWLALKNRLLTRDRMCNFGMSTDPRCVLCSSQNE